jgi:hypothetical protein
MVDNASNYRDVTISHMVSLGEGNIHGRNTKITFVGMAGSQEAVLDLAWNRVMEILCRYSFTKCPN